MVKPGIIAGLQHPVWGACELIRVEGTDWIVRVVRDGRQLRVAPTARRQYTVQSSDAPTTGASSGPPLDGTAAPATAHVSAEVRALRRMFQSLSNGLPPTDGQASRIAVGFGATAHAFGRLLNETDQHGGHATVVRGAYGQGKTFALRVLEDMAVEKGFVVARTEVDATEIQLHKPYHVYRDLIRHLRIPGQDIRGAKGIARQASDALKARFGNQSSRWYSSEARRFLTDHLDCAPLAWLLSDPQIGIDENLIGLLACDLQSSWAYARRRHAIPGAPRDWPAFSATTQGDFASYVLCGLGRLSRLLGFKGFIVILDEMEKWQNLNWVEQSKAGNLLGGLVWGATSPEGKRTPNHYPPGLQHSGRCGGYPFSTGPRCHVGVAIAMTPRGHYGPERTWETYGDLSIYDLPAMRPSDVEEHCRALAPQYAAAYELRPMTARQLEAVVKKVMAVFHRQGTATARAAVQAVVAALDDWRRGS